VRVRPYSLRVRRTRTCAERVPPYSRVRSTRTLCALCRAPSFCVAQSLGVSPLSDALGGVRHAHWASDYPLLASQRATKSLRCSCTRNLLYSYNSKASRLLGYATDPQHQTPQFAPLQILASDVRRERRREAGGMRSAPQPSSSRATRHQPETTPLARELSHPDADYRRMHAAVAVCTGAQGRR
jgi:hypothetical protein